MKNPKLKISHEKFQRVQSYLADADKWDNGELGRDDAYVKVADSKHLAEINEALGLKNISINLPKALHSDLELLAKTNGVSLQSLIRNILNEHIETAKS